MGVSFDIVYSPDDDGWYAQEFPSGRTTAVYYDSDEARRAARRGEWEDED